MSQVASIKKAYPLLDFGHKFVSDCWSHSLVHGSVMSAIASHEGLNSLPCLFHAVVLMLYQVLYLGWKVCAVLRNVGSKWENFEKMLRKGAVVWMDCRDEKRV